MKYAFKIDPNHPHMKKDKLFSSEKNYYWRNKK
jgi:hypothetical protein